MHGLSAWLIPDPPMGLAFSQVAWSLLILRDLDPRQPERHDPIYSNPPESSEEPRCERGVERECPFWVGESELPQQRFDTRAKDTW